MKCSFPDCKNNAWVTGLCYGHYFQRRRGSPLGPLRPIRFGETRESRFENRFLVNEKTGCHEWTGNRAYTGYGYLMFKGKRYMAHRFVYETLVKKIPSGKILCHKCDNPPCVNPEHMFIGTHATNALDKVMKKRHPRSGKNQCKHGHQYTEETMYYAIHPKSGRVYRRCRICIKNQNKKQVSPA